MQYVKVKIQSQEVTLKLTDRALNIMKIKNYIDQENIDISKKLTITKYNNIATCGAWYIKRNILDIRKQRGIEINYKNINFREIKKSTRTSINYSTLADEQYRGAPRVERKGCDKIVYALQHVLPKGGIGIFIGTPAMFSASPISYYPLLCVDNFEVFCALKRTTDCPGKIIIGNAFNKKKALLKAQEWRSNNSSYKFETVVGRVDKYSFKSEVEKFAKLYKLVKVVLMTSGTWEDSKPTKLKRRKQFPNSPELDLNFKEPSIELTSKYDNLHILAMTLVDQYVMNIKYLHDGNIEDIKIPKVNKQDLLR